MSWAPVIFSVFSSQERSTATSFGASEIPLSSSQCFETGLETWTSVVRDHTDSWWCCVKKKNENQNKIVLSNLSHSVFAETQFFPKGLYCQIIWKSPKCCCNGHFWQECCVCSKLLQVSFDLYYIKLYFLYHVTYISCSHEWVGRLLFIVVCLIM